MAGVVGHRLQSDVAGAADPCRRHLQTSPARLEQATQSTAQQASEVLAKRLRQERVENWVETAVHVRQTVGGDLEHNDEECVVDVGTMLSQKDHLQMYTAHRQL